MLIVEDHERLARAVAEGLRREGMAVDVSLDGSDALTHVALTRYDVVVLDRDLPGVHGDQVCRRVMEEHRETRVLMLTAASTISDRVEGLELGADDYLVKPFAYAELLARIRTVLRRGPARRPDTIRVADLEVDLVRHRAARAGRPLDLTPKEFALLTLLARRAREVLSRTLITEQVWDVNFDADSNVVDVHVRRLRAKADDPFDRKLIHTVRGMGYVLDDAR